MTELIWDGKYKDGKKQAPVQIALPFQTIETVNESAADREKRLNSLFNTAQQATQWRNRLIWGDKKYVLPSLMPEFAGKINLIYIDPPFNVGSDFSFTATIAENPDTPQDEQATFTKQPSIIEQKAYRDTWGKGLDSYLQWFYETAVLLRELLADNGSIYVHLDWHVGHYAKAILDEVFGYDNFMNEIVWYYTNKIPDTRKKKFTNSSDFILLYSKSEGKQIFYPQFDKRENPIKVSKMKKVDGKKVYIKDEEGKGLYDVRYERTADNVWQFALLHAQPEIVGYPTQKPEALLERIIKASSNEGDLVLDCFCGSGTTAAVSEKLNRRWITCDLGRFSIHTARKRFLGIADVKPFVVQNLGKYERQQWQQAEFNTPPAGADLLAGADLQSVPQFKNADLTRHCGLDPAGADLQSVPKTALQKRLEQEKSYKNFICDLYHANSLNNYTYIHGTKAGRMIHVGSVDAPVTVEDIKNAIIEFWNIAGKKQNPNLTRHCGLDPQSPENKAVPVAGADLQSVPNTAAANLHAVPQTNGIDFLGWDFAFDVNETAAQFAASNRVDVKFKKIPREVLEKKAVEQGDIKFYELAALEIKTKTDKNKLSISLENFIIPPDDIPDEVRTSITHWSQWIDYWAVDWNYRDDTFHNEWQSYRTKQNPKIELKTTNTYEQKGAYTVLVKVIDILGNDTTKAIQINVE